MNKVIAKSNPRQYQPYLESSTRQGAEELMDSWVRLRPERRGGVMALQSSESFMKELRIKRLKKMFPKYVGRWVPVKEALPPERMGVLIARNDLDNPAYAYLRYAAGDPWSPFFVCPARAGIEERGQLPIDGLIAWTHWFAPTIDGLPLVMTGLFSDVGVVGTAEVGWARTGSHTRKEQDRLRHLAQIDAREAETEELTQ